MSKGGKREGAGRPVAAPTAVLRVRLPVPDYNAIAELGGMRWARRVLLEALEAEKLTGQKL
jgi:hypothetical protein